MIKWLHAGGLAVAALFAAAYGCSESAATVSGTVTYRERIALTPNAVLEVALVDVSRADAPAEVIGRQVIESPGQVPIAFSIEYDPADIQANHTYAVEARIREGDDLRWVSTEAYLVITRDRPTQVDMVLRAVGE
ncbi:MAG: YbaY family lipoprotein [Armatimonadota bacterium]|nr:MAG: YbaY family lipoprotein [Armatimonadota bacterium]